MVSLDVKPVVQSWQHTYLRTLHSPNNHIATNLIVIFKFVPLIQRSESTSDYNPGSGSQQFKWIFNPTDSHISLDMTSWWSVSYDSRHSGKSVSSTLHPNLNLTIPEHLCSWGDITHKYGGLNLDIMYTHHIPFGLCWKVAAAICWKVAEAAEDFPSWPHACERW